MMTPWAYILIGGMLEAVWATSMKMSNGFTNIDWTLATLLFLALSIFALNQGIKRLPMGSGYAVWVGMGAIGSVIVGIVLFSEGIGALRLLFISSILIGAIGIRFTSSTKNDSSP